MRFFLAIFCFLIVLVSCNSPITSEELLNSAITFHDPNNLWPSFNGSLNVTMETPDQANRDSEIIINLPDDYFYVKAVRDTSTTVFEVSKDKCKVEFNGRSEFTDEEIKTHRLSCERAQMYKDYYTYLYGLPMKLKDPGTNISEEVLYKTFKGKDYLVLKATYDADVGSDIWYFYFDPNTYAMEVYQFYRKDENGIQKDDTGEYILLSDEVTINGIRMPKSRAWYYNKDDGYLGTDILQ